MAENNKGDNFGLPKGLTNGALEALKGLSSGGSDFVNFVTARQTKNEADRDPELTFLVQMTLVEIEDLQKRLLTLKDHLRKK
jgi:hypothetical protein